MQSVCRLHSAPARPQPPEVVPRAAPTTCQPRRDTTSRGRCGGAWCVCASPPARRLRARAPCGGGATEPVIVETRKDGGSPAPSVDQAAEDEAGLLAPEELEVLEEAAIAGEDEGRRPTDYDRRAHIFEESSRVFRELKQRSDVDGGGGGNESGRGGGVTTGATVAETTARNEQ